MFTPVQRDIRKLHQKFILLISIICKNQLIMDKHPETFKPSDINYIAVKNIKVERKTEE
jgi:hypothetical protein